MKYIVLALLTCFAFNSSAQMYKPKKKRKQFYGNQRLHKPLYKWGPSGEYLRYGLQFAVGPTYLFTNLEIPQRDITFGGRPAVYQFDPAGKLGLYGEIGMVHITKRPRKFIQYYEWSLGYKHFAGKEELQIDIYDNSGNIATSEYGSGDFSLGYAFAHLGVHNVFQINPRHFIDHALGINLDYRVGGGNMDYVGTSLPETQFFQKDLITNINYEIGFGFKVSGGFFIIPGVRLPVLELSEWRGGNPSIEWYSSTYQPAIMKLKFVWLFKKDPNRCPPVEVNSKDREMMKNM